MKERAYGYNRNLYTQMESMQTEDIAQVSGTDGKV